MHQSAQVVEQNQAFRLGVTVGGPGATIRPDPPVNVSVAPLAATEGQSFSGTVAAFSDADPSGQPVNYFASIDWGDGTANAQPGTISGWSVSGSHTYAEEGTYAVSVTIYDADTSYNNSTARSSAVVTDAALTASGQTVNSTNPFGGAVASFTDANANGNAADFTASIDWGDSSSSSGAIAQDGGQFVVTGTHTYANLGPYTVTTHICDIGGSCADTTSQVLVYDLSSGGNFVIGDGNGAIGSAVTFWGGQWASANTLSGGQAPDAFKGFADEPNAAPACGTGWSTSPGGSSNPPSGVPSYMALIVSSSVSKSGPYIDGDSPEVVVVKTDAGYGPDPGQPGTGTVVAVLCP